MPAARASSVVLTIERREMSRPTFPARSRMRVSGPTSRARRYRQRLQTWRVAATRRRTDRPRPPAMAAASGSSRPASGNAGGGACAVAYKALGHCQPTADGKVVAGRMSGSGTATAARKGPLPGSGRRRAATPRGECFAQNPDDAVDMGSFGDQRRRDDRRVPGCLEIEPVVEQLLLERMPAPAGLAVGLQFDRRQQSRSRECPRRAGHVLQREDGVEEVRRELARALEQAFALVDVERGASPPRTPPDGRNRYSRGRTRSQPSGAAREDRVVDALR
mgnify:CR=1 FL=1